MNPSRLALRPFWALLFALALLLSQNLGLLHRAAGSTAHAPLHALSQASADVDSHAHEHTQAHTHPHAGDFLGKLFSGHASDADCQIFDQLTFSDAASAMLAVGLSLLLSSALCTFLRRLAGARWLAPFQARGPPFPR